MSKVNHTPGPWFVRELHEDQAEIILEGIERGHAIATVSTWGEAELKANAQLIAAAPELLAALNAYRDAVATLTADMAGKLQRAGQQLERETVAQMNAARILAMAAIAKAMDDGK